MTGYGNKHYVFIINLVMNQSNMVYHYFSHHTCRKQNYNFIQTLYLCFYSMPTTNIQFAWISSTGNYVLCKSVSEMNAKCRRSYFQGDYVRKKRSFYLLSCTTARVASATVILETCKSATQYIFMYSCSWCLIIVHDCLR